MPENGATFGGGGSLAVRDFRLGDEMALHAVFFSAVHRLCSKDYTPEQIAAWAPHPIDAERWTTRMRGLRPFVVEDLSSKNGELVGYADLQESGYIDHFYVAGNRARSGIGRMLMGRIHERAAAVNVRKLFANVSRTARPFFEHFGFQAVEERIAVIDGIALPNSLMRKGLGAPPAGRFPTARLDKKPGT